MLKKLIRTSVLAILAIVGFCGFSTNLIAQDGGGDIPGDIGGGVIDPVVQQQPTQQQTGGGNAGISQGQGLGDVLTLDIEQTEDQRNQGFVGATAPEVRDFFVGAATGGTGSPLVGTRSGTDRPATFGGGVNNSVNSQFTGGSTANARGGQQAGFGAAVNGVTIVRKSIRARLRPSFSAPRPSGQMVATRFNDHFFRQPTSQNVTGEYTINVQDRTAFLDGKINNRQDMDRLVRQLRLEPGVYKVVNRLQVVAQ